MYLSNTRFQLVVGKSNLNEDMVDHSVLTIAKRKQIFKKKDRREVKSKIRELRLKSLKLKKKNLD